jgi:hypothetical protein
MSVRDYIAIGLAVSAGCGGREAARPPCHDCISRSDATMSEGESHVAIGPDEQTLAIAWLGRNTITPTPLAQADPTLAYRFSPDRGATWGPIETITLPNFLEGYDPVIAATDDGSFYITMLGKDPGSIFVAHAPAGSHRFGVPRAITPEPRDYDKPWITRTPRGALLVSYMDQLGDPPARAIVAARSTDGVSWTTTEVATGGDLDTNPWSFLCQSRRTGRQYVVHQITKQIVLQWSDDDGATWPRQNATIVSTLADRLAFEQISCAANGEHVWVSYGTALDPPIDLETLRVNKLDAIKVVQLTGGGTIVEQRFDALDKTASAFAGAPYLVAEPDGAIHVIYYAANRDDDTTGSLRRARLDPGDAAFSASTSISGPLTFSRVWGSRGWIGDYNGGLVSRGSLLLSYTDTSTGLHHVAFREIADP